MSMRIRLMACVMLLSSCMILPVWAGDIIAFQHETPRGPQVLQNVGIKSVIAEFLDPADTGIGKSLGYLLWRETLTAVSDQAGAGVILARAPEGQRLTDILAQDYHRAAVEIALYQKSRMALWGAASEEDGKVHLNTYLTLIDEPANAGFSLVLKSPYGSIEAQIPRTRFNFELVSTTRKALFERNLVTRRSVKLYKEPSTRAQVVGAIAAGAVLNAVDMDGGWFVVKLDAHRRAYIENSEVDVPPSIVDVDRSQFELKERPARRSATVLKTVLDGSYPVQNMRYVATEGLWYQIGVGEKKGWVWAGSVRPRFSLPAVHFLAGIYRFYDRRYKDAAREFSQFLMAPDIEESNVNRAAALQLLGASRLMGRHISQMDPSAYAPFAEAVALTPYDPAAYQLRAIGHLVASRNPGKAVADVAKALWLDEENRGAKKLVSDMLAISQRNTPLSSITRLPEQRQELEALQTQYRIQPSIQ
jgi:hypothetical protein